MKWETYKLKELCSEIVDCVNKTAPTSDVPTPYKMLRTSDIREGKINLENLNCVTKEVYEKWTRRGKLQKGDVIFTREAPLGEVGLVREEKNYFLGQRLVLFRANDKICDGRFLMYSLLWHDNKQAIISKGVGSTVAHLRVPECENIEIKAPDLDIQHRIADILSAYDDLIENNQKQIKLLEEAAQRLYKEWFVDLRFPGHENTKIVDGVPEGWQWCKVRDVADINSSALPKNYKEDVIDYVDLGSVRCGHIETRTRYNLNEAPGRAKRCAKDGDIIWGMVRPNLKAYALVTNPKETDVFSTGFAVLSAKKVPYSYLYCAVTQEEFVGYLVNATNGAAYPAVKPVHFEVADILKPDDKVLEQFHSVADLIYRKKEALENQNHNLSEARDLLLPKLMRGEVEV